MTSQTLDILSPSGTLIRKHMLSANCVRKFSLMNEDSVTLRFWMRDAVKFPVGSSVGDFYITQEQVGKWNESTGVYEYELKFDAYYWLWANRMLRYVISGADSARETSFSLTATINLHAQVILNCLDFLGIGYGGSPFRIETDNTVSQEAKLVRYENLSVLGGIQAIAEAFDCEWWVNGNAIYFGRCENNDSKHVFEAGINTSSISYQQAKSEAPNRLYVYGSDRNLPTNYRKIDGNDTIGGVVARRLMLPEGIPYLQTNPDIPENQIVEQVVVLDSIYPRTDLTVSEEPETYTSTTDDDGVEISETYYRLKYDDTFLFSESYVLPNEELHIIFQSGLLNGMDFGARFNPKGLNEKNADGSWNPDAQMIEVVANEDYGRRLPDDVLKPQKGDKFILSGWDSTKIADLGLIADAEQELLEEGHKALEEYTKDLSTCTCPMAWDYMKPLFESATQPKPGDEVSIIDTVHFGTGGRRSRIIGYEYKLDKPYAECVYTCGENVSVKRLDSIEKKIEGLAKSGTKVQMQNSLDFLSKRYSDRTPYLLSSDKGFEVGNFVSGASGAILGEDAETGQTFGEMDRLFIRVKAYFETLSIINAETLAGKQYITPGGSVKITSVEEVKDSNGTLTGWRCYFLSEQDGEKTETKMIVGDQAISEMFNAKTGTFNKVSNHRYWRLVTAVEQDAYEENDNHYGYIELSASNCEAGSDVPEAGDVLCQLGWQGTGKADRQTAMVFSTVDADAPSIKMYSGINSYSLNDKAIISFGRDPLNNQVYFRLGNSNAKEYLEYTQNNGLKVAGSITTTSTIGDKTLNQYFTDLIPEVSREDIESYVNAIVDPKIDGIQNQIDGVIESFFGFGAPTLTNYPANEWTTDEERKAHNRDTYTDKTEYVDDVTTPTAGQSWKWQYTSPTDYGWIKIADSDTTRALLDAARAQDTADRKRRTFVDTPAPPYDKGDMWVNATYGSQYKNDILRCVTPKSEGQAFSIDDWTLASKYTDDSALNDFIKGYEKTIEEVKTQVDGKAQTWYQPTDPSTNWTTPELKALHIGDLWYNTTNGTTWYWNGTAWKEQNVPDSVFDKIDGKADIFVSENPHPYNENDLWFLPKDYVGANGLGDPKKDYLQGTLMVATKSSETFNPSHWAKKDRYTDNTLAQSAKDEAESYRYLKESLGNAVADLTHINGGLILSTMIALGYTEGEARHILSGMNGSYITALGGRTPAAWYGGNMIDRFDKLGNLITPAPKDAATSIIRMDGSAYFANGNVGFETDGSGWFGDRSTGNAITFANGAMTFGNGIKINLTSGIVGLKETLESFANMLTFFIPVRNDGAPTQWGASDMAGIKTTKNFYSEGEISAYGFQEGQGGGSVGVDEAQVNTLISNYLTLNNYAKKSDIPSAPDLSVYAKKTDIPSLSGYATETWVLGKKYLTQHQSLANYLTKTEATNTYQPKGSYLTQHQSLANYVTLDEVQTIKASKYFAASMRMQGCDIILGTSGSESDDSGDLVWQYGTGQEKMRIYSDNSMTSAVGPYYRCYKKDGTLLYSGRLATRAEVDTKLDASVFNELFAKETQNGKTVIKAKFSLYSVDEMSAFGFQEGSGGTGGVGINASELASYLSINGYATQSWVGNNYHPAGRLINMGSDGVSEAGRYLDFHTIVNGVRGSEDYTARIDAGSAATSRVLTLPTTDGTLATQEWVSGKNYLTSHQSLANYAKLTSPNNLLFASNEFTFIPDSFTGESVWLNYRFGADGNTGKLKEYHFGNGTKGGRASLVAAGFKISGGTSSQALMADGSVKTVHSLSSVTNLGWSGTSGQLTTINTLAYWNGQYSSGSSNLQYCDRGRFGTMATATAADYLKLSGGTLTGTLIQNGASFINNTSEHRLVMGGGSSYCWIDNRAKDETVRNNLILYGDRITTKGYIYATYFKASATTLCENLNADLLDGVHATNFNYCCGGINFKVGNTVGDITTAQFVDKLSSLGAFNYRHWTAKCSWAYANNDTITDSGFGRIQLAGAVIEVWNINSSAYTIKITTSPATDSSGGIVNATFIYRNHGANYNPNWKQIATTSDNVASATKLANTRTIWGQNFNGTGNVSGRWELNGVAEGRLSIFDGTSYRAIQSYLSVPLCLNPIGNNVGIGTTSPAYKLDVKGETCVRNAQLRIGDCARQLIFRNDGTTTYLMFSDAANGSYNALRPLYINNASGNLNIGNGALNVTHGGSVTVGINLTVNNTLNVGATNSNGAIEIFHATPYIDFHFGRSAADYTTRIIEYASGSLRVEGNLYTTGELTALTTSDLRLKRNVRPVDDPLRMLRALGGYRVFDYLPQAGVKDSRQRVGLIYQAVSGVTGERMRKLRPDGYGALNYTCPDYINLIGASVLQVDDEIKMLKKRIEKLEKLKEAV